MSSASRMVTRPMRFLVDEDLPRSLVQVFEKHEHEALHVVDAGIRGAVDEQVARYATSEVIAGIVESFLAREDIVDDLPGRLAIVEPGRARVRKL